MFCAPIVGTLPMPPTNRSRNSLRILRKLPAAASRNLTRTLPNPCQYHLNRSRTLLPIHSSYSTRALRLEQQHSQGPMPAGCTRRCTGRKVRTKAHALEIESSYSVSSYSLLNLVELSCLSGKVPHRPCWLPTVFPPLHPAQNLRPMHAAPVPYKTS